VLSSKDLIERTGISRATLNNYIRSGLVPRPDVLPPEPEDGGAPRLGYFPDDSVARIETIQRLKREGWSLQRILSFFAGDASGPDVPAEPREPVVAPATASTARLSLRSSGQPAYFVDAAFAIQWVNDAARTSRLSPLRGADPAISGPLFSHIGHGSDAAAQGILRFHLEAAKARGLSPDLLFGQLPSEAASRLHELYRDVARRTSDIVAHAAIPPSGELPSRLLYAVQFQEGVLFAYMFVPTGEGPASAVQPIPTPAPLAFETGERTPQVMPVVVFATLLQDAGDFWVRLGVQEYFELVNEVSAEVQQVVRSHGGHTMRLAADRLVCYFLPGAGADPLLDALTAADATKAALRETDRRWKLRKGWDFEVCVNSGLAEGEAWVAADGASGRGDLQVVGDVKDLALQLSRSGRGGAILVTRNLIEKVPAAGRARVIYGIPSLLGGGPQSRVLLAFARLRDIALHTNPPRRVAGLAVAELIELTKEGP
jgi:adenylate cyclase